MSAAYFDHNATTPVDPRVRDAMLPWLSELHGNPSSVHSFGQVAREAVELARFQVAELLGVSEPTQIVFTSSGTEANNAVVLGAGSSHHDGHLLISALEHPSITQAASWLEKRGVEITRVDAEPTGRVDAEAFGSALRPDTFLVCLMLANNEVGTLQPVTEIAEVCRGRGVPFLCDAVQAVGKVPVKADELGVDYLVLGAHKFYGPAGAAALWVRPGASFSSFLHGGGQERRRRAGTENVPAIVGLGKAAELAMLEQKDRAETMQALRDLFEKGLSGWRDVVVHGAEAARLPNTSHVAFLGASAESLMIRLDLAGFAVSAGAACSSGKVEASATLRSMGVSEEEAMASIRVSLGPQNRPDEIETFLSVLEHHVADLRSIAAAAVG